MKVLKISRKHWSFPVQGKDLLINICSNIEIKRAASGKNTTTDLKKKGRLAREMKTPSFGNNSGPDDQYATFRASERREKDLDASSSIAKRRISTNVLAKEVEYSTLQKQAKLLQSKSAILEELTHNTNDDHLVKYASKMGHKKVMQKFKKDSNGGGVKVSINNYFKPRSAFRNNADIKSNINSKTFIGTHSYDQIETNRLPKINVDDFSSKQEESIVRSQER
jgi:hypothetical protein